MMAPLMDTIMDTSAWVTRPERPKGVKDVIKQARRAQSRPEGPKAGPKGRNLEVGARRAPRLLVKYKVFGDVY